MSTAGEVCASTTLTSLTYEYDGQRVLSEHSSVPNSGTGTPARFFIDGPTYIDEHLVMHDGYTGKEHYYLPQELHTVAALADETGALVESYRYDAYGAVSVYDATGQWQPTSSVGNPYFFTGRRLDIHSSGIAIPRLDLYHYRARTLNSRDGRFYQRDPIGYIDGMNLYEYVRSNPFMWTDPTGWGPYKVGTQPPPHPVHDPGSGIHGRETATAADYATWFEWIGKSGGALLKGKRDASRHMRHYLLNSGTELTIRASGLFTEEARPKRLHLEELNRAMKFIEDESRQDAYHIVSKTWDPGKTDDGTAWFLAVGGFKAYGAGEVERIGPCRYKIEFVYTFDDKYNWDAGKKTKVNGGITLDAELGRLHVVGFAQEFHMAGRYKRTVEWNTGERFNVNTGRLGERPSSR